MNEDFLIRFEINKKNTILQNEIQVDKSYTGLDVNNSFWQNDLSFSTTPDLHTEIDNQYLVLIQSIIGQNIDSSHNSPSLDSLETGTETDINNWLNFENEIDQGSSVTEDQSTILESQTFDQKMFDDILSKISENIFIHSNQSDQVDCDSIKSDKLVASGSNIEIRKDLDQPIIFESSDRGKNSVLRIKSSTSQPLNNRKSLLRMINGRKEDLTCYCGSIVKNIHNHLKKKHSSQNLTKKQRKDIVKDIIENTIENTIENYLSSQLTLPCPIDFENVSSKHGITKINKNISGQQHQDEGKKSKCKCPLCKDEKQPYANISDHLIKIHHLEADERKVILNQIKEHNLNSAAKQQDVDSFISPNSISNLSDQGNHIFSDEGMYFLITSLKTDLIQYNFTSC